jgi:predicted ester cyclase
MSGVKDASQQLKGSLAEKEGRVTRHYFDGQPQSVAGGIGLQGQQHTLFTGQ